MAYYLLVRDTWRICDSRLLDTCLIKSGSGPAMVAKEALKRLHSVNGPFFSRVDQRGCRARQKCQSASPYVPIHSCLFSPPCHDLL